MASVAPEPMASVAPGLSGSHQAHSKLSPSSAHRWVHCTASVLHQSAERRSSVFADEGTAAHDVAAACLIDGTDTDNPHVQLYVNHCRELVTKGLLTTGPKPIHELATPGSEVMVERSVPLFYQSVSPSQGTTGEGEVACVVGGVNTGTVDFALVNERGVFIRDLKYGQGVLVDAEQNEQLAIYALSLVRDLESDGLYTFAPTDLVSLGIVQPRHHGAAPIRTWDMTLAELEEFCAAIEMAAERIARGLYEYHPGEHACRWCDHRRACEALRADTLSPFGDNAIDLLSMLPDLTKAENKLEVEGRVALVVERLEELNDTSTTGDGLTEDALSGISEDKLVAIWNRRKAITRWLDDIDEMLTERAAAGRPAPGTKLVRGRPGNRKWANEEAADKLLASRLLAKDRYVKVLVSPTVAEELLELEKEGTRFRNRFAAAVSRSDGRPVLAPTSDKRPAIEASVDLLPDIEED